MANQQPISLDNQHRTFLLMPQDIYPSQATLVEMHLWTQGNIPANPITAVVPNNHGFNNARQYTPASNAPAFVIPLPDQKPATVQRERNCFIAHHGHYAQFDPSAQATFRSVSFNINAAVFQNGVPDPNHWAWKEGVKGNQADVGRPWEQGVRLLMRVVSNNCQGGMVSRAKAVWEALNPVVGDVWHTNATEQARTNLVKMMLYYIRENVNHRPKTVEFLLGNRVAPHFDVDALYTALYNSTPHLVLDPTTNGFVDIVPILVDWIEISCAHMLSEVFKCYWASRPGRLNRQNTDMLRENFKFIAAGYQHRQLLEDNVHEFPWR